MLSLVEKEKADMSERQIYDLIAARHSAFGNFYRADHGLVIPTSDAGPFVCGHCYIFEGAVEPSTFGYIYLNAEAKADNVMATHPFERYCYGCSESVHPMSEYSVAPAYSNCVGYLYKKTDVLNRIKQFAEIDDIDDLKAMSGFRKCIYYGGPRLNPIIECMEHLNLYPFDIRKKKVIQWLN